MCHMSGVSHIRCVCHTSDMSHVRGVCHTVGMSHIRCVTHQVCHTCVPVPGEGFRKDTEGCDGQDCVFYSNFLVGSFPEAFLHTQRCVCPAPWDPEGLGKPGAKLQMPDRCSGCDCSSGCLK